MQLETPMRYRFFPSNVRKTHRRKSDGAVGYLLEVPDGSRSHKAEELEQTAEGYEEAKAARDLPGNIRDFEACYNNVLNKRERRAFALTFAVCGLLLQSSRKDLALAVIDAMVEPPAMTAVKKQLTETLLD